MELVEVSRGFSPIVLGLPHAGTWLPPRIAARLNRTGRALADTDWHVDRLYDGLLEDVTIVRATFHRYVIDANRDPSGASLYPGQNTTGLVPLTDFDGRDIWSDPPDEKEIEARRQEYHAPYHAALLAELVRLRAAQGVALLYDCHSIRSRIPFLFEGTLPDFNIGTNDGTSCAPEIEAAVTGICTGAEGYSSVLNGRFRGGWSTRHYGRPQAGIHAIQMELAQSTYLAAEAPPWDYDPDRAARVRLYLKNVLQSIVGVLESMKRTGHDEGH
ncbi:MAG: N-formylglutamate deformylase [Alphaproteobacteria bacterium]|nr:MAG: N-formylglutamate deformylase [Alphaproteobacteria bacterium]